MSAVAPGGPPPEMSYLRMPAGVRGVWWRLVISVLLAVIGLVAVSVFALLGVFVAARLMGYPDFTLDVTDGINVGELLGTNIGLALLMPVAIGLAWWLYDVRPRWLSSVKPGVRWGWLGLCLAMTLAVFGLLLVAGTVGAVIERDTPLDKAALAFLLVVLLTTPLQVAGEEYLFRGLLLQAFGATRLPELACCLATGLLFGAVHLQFDPPLLADRVLLGAVFAWLTIRTGGLEAAIAVHLVNNLAVLIPAGLLGDVDAQLDPTDITWLPLGVHLVLLGILVPWILFVWRRHGDAQPPGSA